MTSRLFIVPSHVQFVETVLKILEAHGIVEVFVRRKSPGFTEIEAMGWNLLSQSEQILALSELIELNYHYLISMK